MAWLWALAIVKEAFSKVVIDHEKNFIFKFNLVFYWDKMDINIVLVSDALLNDLIYAYILKWPPQ